MGLDLTAPKAVVLALMSFQVVLVIMLKGASEKAQSDVRTHMAIVETCAGKCKVITIISNYMRILEFTRSGWPSGLRRQTQVLVL